MGDRPDQIGEIKQTISVSFDLYMDEDGELVGRKVAVKTDDGDGWCSHAVLLTLADFMRDLLAGDVEEAARAYADDELPAGIHIMPTVGEA